MEIKYWAGTDVGRKRSDNEDNFLIDKRLRLFVVADGMGGHASGEIASAMAVHGIREVLHAERDILDVYDDDDPKSHVEVCTLLEYAVHYTCAQIHEKARREPEKRGMGTTLVVLLVIGARGFIAYVGDSRIYLLRGSVVYQLTEDHSLRNELIRMGKITADEFETSPYANLKNAMTRAVGVYESVEVDTLDFDIIPGDAFMLCSDGLYEYLTDDDIAHALALPEIREVPGLLIDSANSRGGKDNITAVVVQVAGGADDKDRAAELNFTLDTLKNVPLFRELSYQQLVRVINLARQSTLEPGEVLCREGEPGHELMVVLRGRVELTQGGVRVAELGAGSHLGEMSLIDEGLRSVTVTALDSGKVLAIGRDDFYEVLRREPALAVKLLWSFVRVLAGRLRATTADLAVARTSAAQVLSDFTELAEETTRAGRLAELDADDEEDELERRPTMIPGMTSRSSKSFESRTTLVSTSSKLPDEPAVRGAPERMRTQPSIEVGAAPTGDAGPPADPSVISSARPRPPSRPLELGDSAAAPRSHASSNPTIIAGTTTPPTAPRPSDTVVAPPPATPRPSDTAVAPPPATPRPSDTVVAPPSVAPQPSAPATTGDTVIASAPAAPRPSAPATTGDTVVAPSSAVPRPSAPTTGDAVAPPPVPPRPRTVSTLDLTADAVTPPPAPPRPRTSSNPNITGDAVVAPAVPRPRTSSNPGVTGDAVVAPAVPRPRTSSNPGITGDAIVATSATTRPRLGSGPATSPEPAAMPRSAPPAVEPPPRVKQATNPMISGESPLRGAAGNSPVVSGELSSMRPPTSNPAITGNTVVPPSAAPRPRRGGPQVTRPIDSSWSPGLPPMGGAPVVPSPEAPTAPLDAPHLLPLVGAPVVPSPQAPTAPLDAPHLLPLVENDAPKTRRTGRRSPMPQMPGTPFTPTPPPAPSPIHSAPTAPLSAPIIPPLAAPTAPLSAPVLPPIVPPLAAPTAPLSAPLLPDVPSRRQDAITVPSLPVVPPPPPPPRGGTMPPPSRSSASVPPPPPPPRTEADSDAPRVPAPRHAVATPQAGGTQPPPGSDDSDTRRTQRGLVVPPPPPPPPRKGDPDDPAPAAEPGS